MFVSIDMDKLRFLHKHHDHDTLSGLAWLEAPNVSIRIENTDRALFLHGLTSLDLCILYKNTTGATVVSAGQAPVLRSTLHDVITHLDAKLALLDEVQAQCEKVEDDLYKGIAYTYVLGSRTPTKQLELIPLTGRPLTPAELAQAETLAGRMEVPKIAPIVPVTEYVPAVKPQRASSVRPVIWAHADKVWEEAGKPRDIPVVLQLRKRMMNELEEQGVKKTSSSNELGNWMKDRLA